MQMQFDLDYVGHSATLWFPSDDMRMHNTAVLPSKTQQDTVVLYVTISSFSLLQLCCDFLWGKKVILVLNITNLVWQTRSDLS